jgi:L-xylulokinase
MASQVKPGCEGLIAYPCANRYPGLTGFTEKEDYPFQHAYLFDSLFEPTARRLRKAYSKHFQHGHYVRALLESTAHSLKEMVGDIRNDRAVSAIVASGGGSRSDLWIEIKSAFVQAPFLIPECTELSCMGAAMIGALGTKTCDDYDGLVKSWVRFREKKQFKQI